MRRAIRLGEKEVVPRVSDLPYVLPALSGKIEFETVDDGHEEQIVEKLIQGAVLAVFNRYFNLGELEPTSSRASRPASPSRSPTLTPSADYVKLIKQIEGLDTAVEKLGADEERRR